MSNYCKRIANGKKIYRGKMTTEKCDIKTPFTAITVGPIKQGVNIVDAISPVIDYLHSIGADNVYYFIDYDTRRVFVYTTDFGLKKEDFEKEIKSPEVEKVVESLATLG